ncbi:MAG: helix-turn-helix domain-containing protein [Bacteroidetes bacterium]|nr:helix-turn-helix domain-containing protein [Bacteroidota bacterium]
MSVLNIDQQVRVYPLGTGDMPGNRLLKIGRAEGEAAYTPDFLLPHRKDYYFMVFVKRGSSRHWVDMIPYDLKDNTFYFTVPQQVHLKEEPKPIWCTSISFTTEFLALQENAALSKLPLILNPQNGHELLLSDPDLTFVEDLTDKIYSEYNKPGEWQQRMLTAYLTVLLTYLSRLYTEQYKSDTPSPDRLLLKRYQAKIDESFRSLHEVAEYAALLNISPGHLGEVVKAQSGHSAIDHIHQRLVLEARRLLFHTDSPIKEIAFDLGFADASYFNRFFKRETGTTPAEYRTSIRKMYH